MWRRIEYLTKRGVAIFMQCIISQSTSKFIGKELKSIAKKSAYKLIGKTRRQTFAHCFFFSVDLNELWLVQLEFLIRPRLKSNYLNLIILIKSDFEFSLELRSCSEAK